MGQKEAQTHTKHNVTVAVAVSTVAVVVLSPMSFSFLGVTRSPAKRRRVFKDVIRLAWVEQHRPRREGDGIGHQNDELLRHVPAHVAHRQPEAEPEEPEEQGIDVLQVVSEPQLSRSNACLNFHHFEH